MVACSFVPFVLRDLTHQVASRSLEQALELLHTDPKDAVKYLERATDVESPAKGDAFGHLSTND